MKQAREIVLWIVDKIEGSWVNDPIQTSILFKDSVSYILLHIF